MTITFQYIIDFFHLPKVLTVPPEIAVKETKFVVADTPMYRMSPEKRSSCMFSFTKSQFRTSNINYDSFKTVFPDMLEGVDQAWSVKKVLLEALQLYLKRDSGTIVFPVNLEKFLRTTFIVEYLWWLPLTCISASSFFLILSLRRRTNELED